MTSDISFLVIANAKWKSSASIKRTLQQCHLFQADGPGQESDEVSARTRKSQSSPTDQLVEDVGVKSNHPEM